MYIYSFNLIYLLEINFWGDKVIGKVFSYIVVFSIGYSVISGNFESVSMALVTGAQDGVNLSISLLGTMCIWSGIMRVFDACGLTREISKLIKPILRLIYSKETVNSKAGECICSSIAANFFGLGNAALPLGIRAVKEIKKSGSENAKFDIINFCILNTVPFQLLPTTLIALLTKYNCKNPYDILLPIWICSAVTIIFAIILCKVMSKVWRNKYDS